MKNKKIIKIISTLLAFSTLISVGGVANASVANKKTKDYYNQIITDKYGEDGILNDGFDYSWDYNDVVETDELVSGEISLNPVDSPMWNAGTSSSNYSVHGAIIDVANETADTKIPAKYLDSVVKVVCQWCDTKWYVYEKDANKNYIYDSDGNKVKNEKAVEAVHASSNYLATLKYLWKFAKEIAKHETGANVTTDVNNASAKALAQLPAKVKKSGTVAGDMIAQLDNMTKRIIKAHYKVTSAHPTQTEGGKCKYIIYGMLMHLFGDLYAHRLKVPKTSVEAFKSGFNSANFNSKKMFYKSDFSASERSSLISAVEAKEVSFTQIKNYVNTSSAIYTKLNSKYVDNKNFYPGRVVEAEDTAATFLDWYSDGFEAVLVDPYNFTLDKYDTYLEAIES
jgi:Zn-finger protein